MGKSHAWAVIFKGSPHANIFVVPGDGIGVLQLAIAEWAKTLHAVTTGSGGWADVVETKHLGEAVNLREFVEAVEGE